MLLRAYHRRAQPPWRFGVASVVLMGATSGQLGCWCAAEQSPTRTVSDVVEATEQGDAARLQRDVVDDSDRMPALADVEAALKREGRNAVEALRSAQQQSGALRITARYRLVNGAVVLLSKQNGEYRVRYAPLLAACPATVLDALIGLRTAVEFGRGPLGGAPLTARAAMDIEHEHQAILAGLRSIEELDLAEGAAAAHVTLPSGHVVSLRLEQGCWLVDEVS